MTKISLEERQREETDLVRAINKNNERLSNLRGNLNGLRNMKESYNEAKEKCKDLAKKLYGAAIGHILLVLGATVGLYHFGHPVLGNVVLELGMLSTLAYPIAYQIKTKKERKTINDIKDAVLTEDDECTVSEKLQIEEGRLKNAIGRRLERSESLNNELRVIRGEKVEANYSRRESPVIGEAKSYIREK